MTDPTAEPTPTLHLTWEEMTEGLKRVCSKNSPAKRARLSYFLNIKWPPGCPARPSAWAYLRALKASGQPLPYTRSSSPHAKQEKGRAPLIKPSNSELRRWLESSSVLIDGVRPGPDDLIELPLKSLVFFPKSSTARTTML